MPIFEPWVGPLYWEEGLDGYRLLILGESHYGDPGTEYTEFTINVVRELGQEKRHAFFTKVQKFVMRIPKGVRVSDSDRAAFWNRVAFYNYIQSLLAGPRVPKQQEHWDGASKQFIEVLNKLNPHGLLRSGHELSKHLPAMPTRLEVIYTAHPSSGGFSYKL